MCVLQGGSQKFDPMSLEPDKVTLELEIGPSVVLLFGAWLRKFMHLKVGVLVMKKRFWGYKICLCERVGSCN